MAGARSMGRSVPGQLPRCVREGLRRPADRSVVQLTAAWAPPQNDWYRRLYILHYSRELVGGGLFRSQIRFPKGGGVGHAFKCSYENTHIPDNFHSCP